MEVLLGLLLSRCSDLTIVGGIVWEVKVFRQSVGEFWSAGPSGAVRGIPHHR